MARTTSERMHAYRQRLRERGLRPVQLWVPDTSAPGFAEEARRQARRLAESGEEAAVADWAEAVAAWPDEKE